MIYHDVDSHTYYDDTKLIYDSPTKILGLYKNKFPALIAAKAYVKKHGKTVDYWLKEWKKKSTTALDRGHKIHSQKEDFSYGRGIEVIKKRPRPVQNGSLYRTENLIELPDGVYPELNIWNNGWKIAGRPDKIDIETIDGIRYVDMYDYKSNGKIDKVSYQDDRGNYKMLKAPLQHLMDCSWVHYTLQMSFYQYMLETHGFKPRSQTIIHIPHPIDMMGVMIQPPDVLYNTPYAKEEILNLLEHYDKTRKRKYYK